MADTEGERRPEDLPPPPPPPAGAPPAGTLRNDEKQWGALAHVAVVSAIVLPVVGGPLGPLIVRLTKGKESRFVDANALEALNFGILLAGAQLAVGVVGSALAGAPGVVGIYGLGRTANLLSLIVTVVALVLPAMAALKANNAEMGRYPEAMPRLVKE